MHRRIIFIATICFMFTSVVLSAADDMSGFSPSRHRAALIALFMQQGAANGSGQNEKLKRLTQSLIFNGGFTKSGALSSLGMQDNSQTRISNLFKKLNVAAGLSDGQATKNFDPLLIGANLGLAYTDFSENGPRAAGQLAGFTGQDPLSVPCARAACRLVAAAIKGKRDKTRMLDVAADDAGDETVARAVRMAELSEWKDLKPESTPLGKLERALYIWSRSKNYRQADEVGGKHLNTFGGRRFLQVLAAATYGQSALPEKVIASAMRNADTRELVEGMGDLAADHVLVDVPEDTGSKQTNKQAAATSANPDEAENTQQKQKPAAPALKGFSFPKRRKSAEHTPASTAKAKTSMSNDFAPLGDLKPLEPLKPLD